MWPSLDAEHSRSGAGMATTRFLGMRYTGEPTSVIQLRAVLSLARSGPPAPEYRPRALTGRVFVRPLTKDVRGKVADFALTPDDPGAAERPPPLIRAPANFWVSSLARTTELTGTEEVHGNATRILRGQFPGFLPRSEGGDGMLQFLPSWLSWLNPANKFTAANQQALRAFAADLRKNIRTARSHNGHTVQLTKAGAFGFRQEQVTVRVRMRAGEFRDGEWAAVGPQPSAWLPDSELDAFHMEEQDTLASRALITGGWLGLQLVIGIGEATARAAGGLLDGFEVRPMGHGRWVNVTGAYSGLVSWAMHGYSIDDLFAFRGPATLFLTVEGQDRPATWDFPSLLLFGSYLLLLTAVNPQLTFVEALIALGPLMADWLAPRALNQFGRTAALAAHPTEAIPAPMSESWQLIGSAADLGNKTAGNTASLRGPDAGDEVVIPMPPPDPARGRRRLAAPPVRAEYEMIMPTSMTLKQQPGANEEQADEQRWVPYDTGRTDADGRDTGLPPAPLEFTATVERPFPAHLIVETLSDVIVPTIDDLLAAQGFTRLPADAHGQIRQAVAAARGAGMTVREAPGPVDIWEGKVADVPLADAKLSGHSIMGRVKLHTVVQRAETIALPESYGTWNDHGLVAVVGKFTEKTGGWPLTDWWSHFLGLRLRLPVHWGRLFPNETPADNDDPPTNTAFTLTPQPQQFYRLERSRGVGTETAGSVGRMNLEIGPLAVARVAAEHEIVVETWHVRSLVGKYGEQSSGRRVPDIGFTVLASSDATGLGLMPEGLRLRLDLSVGYRIPADQENSLRAETVAQPPNFTHFVSAVIDQVEQRLGAEAAKLVEEELGKIRGGYTSAAFLAELSNGGGVITVTFPDKYPLPLPGGHHVGTLRAIRVIRIALKGRLDEQQFMGVVPIRHYLGFRTALERNAEVLQARAARWGTDLIRFWNIFNLPSGAINAIWNNWVWQKSGQTVRKEGAATWSEDSIGTITDTSGSGPGQPDGPGQFLRKVHLSADVSVGTAPPVSLDAVTLGATQSWQHFAVPEDEDTATYVVTRHDPYTLDRDGVPAPAAAPAPPGGPPAPARPQGTRLPAGEPRQPAVTLLELTPADNFAELRQGLPLPAELMAEAQARYPGKLAGLGDKLSQLMLPLPAAYAATADGQRDAGQGYLASFVNAGQNLWNNRAALWANYVWNPPAGASLHHPQGVALDQATLLAGNTYLTGSLLRLITGVESTEIVLPRRGTWPTVTLEHLADVEYVHITGRETPNQMLKLFHANADSISHQVEVLSGTLLQHWTEIAGQLPDTSYDYNNDLGPLIDVDHIIWDNFIASSRERFGHDVGLKRTHLGMFQVFLGVRYAYGVNPHKPAKGLLDRSRYWPGPRQYFRDDQVRWAEIWVPVTQKNIWQGLANRAPQPAPAVAGASGEASST